MARFARPDRFFVETDNLELDPLFTTPNPLSLVWASALLGVRALTGTPWGVRHGALQQITDCVSLELQNEAHVSPEVVPESTYRTRVGPLGRFTGRTRTPGVAVRGPRGANWSPGEPATEVRRPKSSPGCSKRLARAPQVSSIGGAW